MTLPFENDTNPIVKKISKRNLKADKSRNVLIIITIALATCLIMATLKYVTDGGFILYYFMDLELHRKQKI